MHTFTAIFVLSLASVASVFPLTARRVTVWNGRAELCNRNYGNITFIGSYNNYATSTDVLDLSRDQEVSKLNRSWELGCCKRNRTCARQNRIYVIPVSMLGPKASAFTSKIDYSQTQRTCPSRVSGILHSSTPRNCAIDLLYLWTAAPTMEGPIRPWRQRVAAPVPKVTPRHPPGHVFRPLP